MNSKFGQVTQRKKPKIRKFRQSSRQRPTIEVAFVLTRVPVIKRPSTEKKLGSVSSGPYLGEAATVVVVVIDGCGDICGDEVTAEREELLAAADPEGEVRADDKRGELQSIRYVH